MMKNIPLIFLLLLFTAGSCAEAVIEKPLVNPAHLNHLYEEVVVGRDTMGIVHIYAEYPDYRWFDDSDEGTACIDDGARAMSFYLDYYKYSGDYAALLKAKRLLNYIFYMQADNGWFYNFTWKDNTINKEFRTSTAEPNWWSWRAFRALAEAGEYFKSKDETLYNRIRQNEQKLLKVLLPWLEKEKKYKDFSGFNLPAWLPYETAADQASIILEALSIYYRSEEDAAVIPYIKNLADGIMQMQAGSNGRFPYNAFLSWQNTWHAWGNAQADALLMAGKAAGDTAYISSALKEIKYFYPYLQKNKYLTSFVVEKNGDLIDTAEVHKYSQIAYGMRPMITAALAAYDITKDTNYAALAGRLACWFFGDNPNTEFMYDPEAGRGYDGITDERKINKNSGAESTIESLISLLAVEKNDIAKRICKEYYEKRK
jgi:hypothetical protein